MANTEWPVVRLNYPTHDPLGDPIPGTGDKMVVPQAEALTSLGADQAARAVHLEDEPPAPYGRLAAEGLHPVMEVRLLENSPQRIRYRADGGEHVPAHTVGHAVTFFVAQVWRLVAG